MRDNRPIFVWFLTLGTQKTVLEQERIEWRLASPTTVRIPTSQMFEAVGALGPCLSSLLANIQTDDGFITYQRRGCKRMGPAYLRR